MSAEEGPDAEYPSNEYNELLVNAVDRALYDPELEANWIEMAISTNVYFPQRNVKKTYFYQYTLRIWDGNRTSEAAATGTLGQLMFDKDPPLLNKKINVKASTASTATAGSACSYNGEGRFDGVEQY